MRFSTAFIALAAPFLVSAAPARFYGNAKRAAEDVLVFTFADVLEQLESEFYAQAIAKFQDADFTAAGFTSAVIPVEQFQKIQADEATHSVVLQAALKAWGAEPITTCKFNFESALTDVATMAATARVVESVGVAAYLGAAGLLTDPVFLNAAGSILTVEARHQTILNVLSGSGTAIPAAFDFSLTPSEVLALAVPFIDPASPCDLGVPANPSLSITNTGTVAPGTALTFSSAALNGTVAEDTLFCQMLLGGAESTIALPFNQCVVPADINGPVAIWITSDGQPLLNNPRDRASTQLIAGPTLAFIDTEPQQLGQLARGGAVEGAAPAESTSTRTISPAEASSIIAGATETAAVVTDAAAATATATDAAAAAVTDAAAATATATDAAAAAATPVANAAAAAAPAPGEAGGPNTFTGLSADGMVQVNGWTNV